MIYRGERVRLIAVIGRHASIWIPSRQQEAWVPVEKLREMPLGHDPRFCATCVERPRGGKFCQEEIDEAGRCTGYSH